MNKYLLLTVMLLFSSMFSTTSILAQSKIHPPTFQSFDYDQIQQREELLNRKNRNDEGRVRIRPEIFDAMQFPDSPLPEMFLQNEQSALSGQSAGNWIGLGPEGGWIETLVMDPTNHNILYAQCYGLPTQIYRSDNGGASWQLHSSIPNAYITTISIDPNNPLILYAAYSRYLFKSEDGGLNWNRLQITPSESPNIVDIFVCPTNSNFIYVGGHYFQADTVKYVVYRSPDGGLNWSKAIASPSGYYRCYALCFTVNPKNPDELYIGGYHFDGYSYSGLLLRSLDGGVNWTNIYAGISGYVYAIAIDPLSPNKIYAGTYQGIYRSSNSGATWSKNSGYAYCYELSIDPVNTNILYAGYDSGIFRSANGGVNWSYYSSGLEGTCYALIVDHTTTSNIFYGSIVGVYRSQNSGMNWLATNSGLIANRIPAISISPSDPKTLYIEVDDNAVFKTTDFGDNWIELPDFLACGNINAIAVDPTSSNIAYALEGSG